MISNSDHDDVFAIAKIPAGDDDGIPSSPRLRVRPSLAAYLTIVTGLRIQASWVMFSIDC
jgi:hypothetical protein